MIKIFEPKKEIMLTTDASEHILTRLPSKKQQQKQTTQILKRKHCQQCGAQKFCKTFY